MRLDHILSGKHGLLISAQYAKLKMEKDKKNSRRICERLHTDPKFRASCNARNRLKAALRVQRASRAYRGLIGCTMPELMAHLERQFTEGMTWENYGKWHIDHIRPCSSFNLLHAEEQAKCFHYTNLQPLWAIDNLKKGNKM